MKKIKLFMIIFIASIMTLILVGCNDKADTVAPTVSITTPTTANAGDEIVVSYNVNDNVTSVDKLLIEVTVVKEGNLIELTNNKFIAEVGTYTIKVKATDEALNSGSSVVDVVVNAVDTTKPTVSLDVVTKATEGDEIEVLYNLEDDSDIEELEVTLSVTKDGKNIALSNNKFIAEKGEYVVSITVKDKAGNIASDSKTIIVAELDTTSPTIEITTDPIQISGTDVVVDFNVTDNVSSEENITIDIVVTKNGEVVELSGYTFNPLPGEYVITITATDEALNETVQTLNINVEDVSYREGRNFEQYPMPDNNTKEDELPKIDSNARQDVITLDDFNKIKTLAHNLPLT